MKPGVEAPQVAQRGEVPPGSDERLLDGVLGPVGIAQDQPGGRVHALDRGARERGKGVMVASSRTLHEIQLHLAPSAAARPM